MPCTDGGPSAEQIREEQGIKASWCAILTVLEETDQLDAVLRHANWEEAGVSEDEVRGWWAGHKRRDQERRKREETEQYWKQMRQRVLQKLSPEEREAINSRW